MLDTFIQVRSWTAFIIRALLVVLSVIYAAHLTNAQTVKKTVKVRVKTVAPPVQTARNFEPEVVSRAQDEVNPSTPPAQTNPTPPKATPTPTPTPTPGKTPTAQPPTTLQKVNDTQNVTPENIEGVPDIAPNYRSNDRDLPEIGRVGVDLMQPRTLSLRESIEKALQNNKDIEVARQNVRLSEFDFTAADGFYDPRLTGTTYVERAKIPNFSFFGGGANGSTTSTSLTGNLEYQGFIRKYGTSYRVDLNNNRGTTDNTFTSVNPTYTTTLSFSFTQPLLRGRRIDQARRSIEVAKKNLSLTDTQFRQRTIDVITNVQRAYWDLTYTLKNLQVQRDAVRDAKDQLAHNQRLVQEGVNAPIAAVAAQTQVANFEQNVYTALDDVNRAENTLKNLISPNRNDEIWGYALVPTDSIELDPPAVSLPEALQTALENRPEIQLNNVSKEINQIDQLYYKDQTRPQVDLVGSYLITGAAGILNSSAVNPLSGSSAQQTQKINELIGRVNAASPTLPPISTLPVSQQTQTLPAYLTGGYEDVFGNLFTNRFPTVRVGVQLNIPLKNRTAEAQFGRTLVVGEQLNTQREQIEQNIQVDVRNSLQALRTAQARLRAAAISRENSEKQYESEKRKFDEGQSTLFLVLERQTALTTARGNELRSQTEINKAIADLQRATGNSLRANNVIARLR